MSDNEKFLVSKYDKRPIAKFYRCWLQDVENGMPENRCRGITCDQFKAADRLSTNYERIFKGNACGYIKLPQEKTFKNGELTHTEYQAQIIQTHNAVFKQLGTSSAKIIEHIVLHELPIREYELKQIPKWAKGAGIARLREALTELIEIYRTQK